MLTAQRRMFATVGGALSETVATVSLRIKRMLSTFRLRNKKCSEPGPNRRCSGSGTVPETVPVRSLISVTLKFTYLKFII